MDANLYLFMFCEMVYIIEINKIFFLKIMSTNIYFPFFC